MTLFHNCGGAKWHQIDRPPTSEVELKLICKNFPGAIVHRKSNNWVCHLYEIKLKNWNWYK